MSVLCSMKEVMGALVSDCGNCHFRWCSRWRIIITALIKPRIRRVDYPNQKNQATESSHYRHRELGWVEKVLVTRFEPGDA